MAVKPLILGTNLRISWFNTLDWSLAGKTVLTNSSPVHKPISTPYWQSNLSSQSWLVWLVNRPLYIQ